MRAKRGYADALIKLLGMIEKLPKGWQACLIGLVLVTSMSAFAALCLSCLARLST